MSILGVSLTGVGIATILRKVRAREARALANTVFRGVKDRTPVDTGRAKRGWAMRPKRGGYLIYNNVPYIGVLDKGRHMTPRGMRGSLQAPKGMTKPTLDSIRNRSFGRSTRTRTTR